MSREVVWILGAGRFGSLAARRLLAQGKASRLVVIDQDADQLRKLAIEPVERVQHEAVDFLVSNLGSGPDWIVPAIPVHVAFAWLCSHLSRAARVMQLPVPRALDSLVPHPFRDKEGGLYATYANFRCPDTCEEPRSVCTVTGRPRGGDLFRVLSEIEVPGYLLLVVRSHQLAPGVGGYRPSVLWYVLQRVKSTGTPAMVATACRCHGVVHALRWEVGVPESSLWQQGRM